MSNAVRDEDESRRDAGALAAAASSGETMSAGVELGLRQRFLDGMSSAACTVNVVTTDGPAGRFGVTVSAMASVSADLPRPMLLVCIHHRSASAQAIIDNGVFCVNVLRDDQSFISDCFSGRAKTADGDKFSCATWVPDVTGAPRLADPLVAFSCRIVSAQQMGTHHVFFGTVEDILAVRSGSPLIYANRAYGTPSRIDGARSDRPTAGEALKLGAFHTFGPYLVPRALDRLARSGMSVDVQLIEGDQRRLVEGLRTGQIELALLYDLGLSPDVATERLTASRPFVLIADSHPFAGRASLSLAELAAEPLILLDAPPSGDYFVSLFTRVGLAPHIRLRSSSFEMVRGLVAHGFGYSLMATKPASSVSYDGLALTTRPLVDAVEPSHVVLATRHDARLGRAAEAFAQACRDLFKTA